MNKKTRQVIASLRGVAGVLVVPAEVCVTLRKELRGPTGLLRIYYHSRPFTQEIFAGGGETLCRVIYR
jgi:hypothetical protein